MSLTPDNFSLKTPCGDCPFLRDGGVRHGPHRVASYASYFTEDPFFTFPCHKTVPKSVNRETWTDWNPESKICAGGLAFAENVGQTNAFLSRAKLHRWYHPLELATARVFRSLSEMVLAQDQP